MGLMDTEGKEYIAKYKTPKQLQDTGADYEHTRAHQAAYDFSVYLHLKCQKMPKYEKFTLQAEIRGAIDAMLDEIEAYEVTGSVTHLYAADHAKRKLLRKIRLAHDLKYSAMNSDSLMYCAVQLSIIGKLIGGIIEKEKAGRIKEKGGR
jgi:hypothetical protein